MLIVLDHGHDADTFVLDAVSIFGPDFRTDPGSFQKRVGRYTDAQKAAVAGFLRVQADDEDSWRIDSTPKQLLDAYWGRYL